MDYLICQDWGSTSGNHAGIRYLCEELQRRHPDIYYTYYRPYYNNFDQHKNFFKKVLNYFRIRKKVLQYNLSFERQLLHKLRKGDRVFLMEYPGGGEYSQISFARTIKKHYPEIPILGMFHLVPSLYNASFTQKKFNKISSYIDFHLTLGHSLSDYLTDIRNIDRNRVITLFHYVDSDYYSPINFINNAPPVVIVMGNMQRNYNLLSKIVEDTSDAHFIICQGRQDLSEYFKHVTNVELVSYIPEQEFKLLMDKADISLNVMDDTIGSNVIVTSMAMGLAMVCSDVGSIRDYCSNDNAILCNNDNPKELSEAIKKLCKNDDLLSKLKENSRYMAEQFSIENFHRQLQDKIVISAN